MRGGLAGQRNSSDKQWTPRPDNVMQRNPDCAGQAPQMVSTNQQSVIQTSRGQAGRANLQPAGLHQARQAHLSPGPSLAAQQPETSSGQPFCVRPANTGWPRQEHQETGYHLAGQPEYTHYEPAIQHLEQHQEGNQLGQQAYYAEPDLSTCLYGPGGGGNDFMGQQFYPSQQRGVWHHQDECNNQQAYTYGYYDQQPPLIQHHEEPDKLNNTASYYQHQHPHYVDINAHYNYQAGPDCYAPNQSNGPINQLDTSCGQSELASTQQSYVYEPSSLPEVSQHKLLAQESQVKVESDVIGDGLASQQWSLSHQSATPVQQRALEDYAEPQARQTPKQESSLSTSKKPKKLSTGSKSSPGVNRSRTLVCSSPVASRTNQCGVCGRNYARPSTLKTHLRTHTNERPFKCTTCLKTFSQAANLTAHQRVHTGERPFSCPICGRQFSQSSSVITHLRTHSGERPYRCSMCSRTFSDSSTLTKHCRIHSGEKPYQCDHCPLNFSQSGNLSRHLKLHLLGSTLSNNCTTSSSSSSSSSSSTTSSSSSSSYTSRVAGSIPFSLISCSSDDRSQQNSAHDCKPQVSRITGYPKRAYDQNCSLA